MNYEELYEKVQEITNNIIMFCGFKQLEGCDQKTNELLGKLIDAASEFSNAAHEVEEHFAWD